MEFFINVFPDEYLMSIKIMSLGAFSHCAIQSEGKLGPWPYCHRAQHHPSQDASHHRHSFNWMS